MHHTLLRMTGRISVAALLGALLTISPAHATTGLYGSQDPTYDGVYRHALTIVGLTAHKQSVPASAKQWLATQQCADGGFEAFRANTSTACTPADPAKYAGIDTNSTAAAALAFAALGDNTRASRALDYLRKAQNADGGFPYYAGGDSDVNSTAMAMLAFRANRVAPISIAKNGKQAYDYLAGAMLGCASTSPGAFSFWGEASDKATVQALVALRSTLPWKRAATVNDFWPACPTPSAPSSLWSAAAFYTSKTLAANAFSIPIPAAWGGGTDTSDTAWAALGLIGTGRDAAVAASTVNALRSAAKAYTVDKDGKPLAGRVGLLLLVAAANGDSPRNFGGVDLVTLAKQSLGR